MGIIPRQVLFVFIATLAFVTIASAQMEGGAIAAVDEPAEAAGGSAGRGATVSEGATTKRKPAPAAPRPKPPVRRAPARWDGFVIGDKYTFMNFEVISAEKPYHTREAKAAGAKGLVQVEILIDTTGRVLTARARTGNKLLHPEAERAALASRFNRPTVYGKPARAIGFLVYRFGPREVE
jgi:hypothetical protein